MSLQAVVAAWAVHVHDALYGWFSGASSPDDEAENYDDPATHHLPTELVDQIMDHLWDDKQTLAACSLVSRQWLLSATYHLFRAITVTDDADCARFRQFSRLLQSGSPRAFGQCVRELHLQSWPPGQITTKLVDIDLHMFAVMLHCCPRLQHLQMTRVRWMRHVSDSYPPLVMPSVASLAFSYRDTHVIPDFPGIFNWFPNVRECVLDGGYIPVLDSYDKPVRRYPDPVPFPSHMHLTVLHLKSRLAPWVHEWAAQTSTMRTLESFHAVLGRPQDLTGIARVLRGARNTLVDLALDLTSPDYRMFFLSSGTSPVASLGTSVLPLSQCTALQRLHLITVIVPTTQLDWQVAPVTTTPTYIAWLISSVKSRSLTTVTLEFKGSVEHLQHQMVLPQWNAVEDVLVHHPTVKVVEILWDDAWEVEGIRKAMCSYFYTLYMSGKLYLRQ